MENTKYTKSLQDEIDWKIIDQLHNATLNFSNKSLEVKKLFVASISIVIPSILKITKESLDLSIFVTLYCLIVIFWLLDSYTNYYQVKLRGKMDKKFEEILKRNNGKKIECSVEYDEFTIEKDRVDSIKIVDILFSKSHLIYLLFLISNTLGIILFFGGVIA